MKAKTLAACFACLALSFATASVANGRAVKQIARNTSGFAVTNRHNQSERPSGVYLGASSAALGCLVGGADPLEAQKGIVVGCTFHDFQKYGSMGRQIATDQIFGTINFIWTSQNNNSATQGREVCYEGFTAGFLGDGMGGGCPSSEPIGATDPNERSGFVTMAGVSDGTSINAHQWNRIAQTDPRAEKPYVFKNETPGLRDFVGFGGVGGTGRIPDSAWNGFLAGDASAFIWPQIAFTDVGPTQVAHLVISSNRTDADNTALYLRRVGLLPTDEWETVMELGPAGFHRSFVVSASRISERVGIAFSGGRGDGSSSGPPISRYNGLESGKHDNDLYLILSDNAGATWGPLQNVTRYPDSLPGRFLPHAKLSAIHDANDDFNVAWQARQWPGYEGEFTTFSRIMAWNEASNLVRVAATGVWESTDCLPGFQQLNTDNPQLSECAGKLFLTFTMFAPGSLGLADDCAARAYSGNVNDKIGAANAEIYVSVSSDNGLSWDPPRNLTQTYTPNCDTIVGGANPDCGSEAWHSVTRYGIDITLDNYDAIPDFTDRVDPSAVLGTGEYLFVQYIDDTDPGAAPLSEGGWHDNPVRSFRFGCVDIVGGCPLVSNIAEGQAVDDPTFTLPSEQAIVDWELVNTCNQPISYALTIENQVPLGNVSVTGDDGVIPTGVNNWDSLVITLNANLENVEQHAHAEIVLTGDFVNGQTAGTMRFIIDYTIGNIQQSVLDSIASCLIYDNRGSIGSQAEPYLSFDLQGTPSECDTNALSYLFDGSPIVSYPGDGSNIVASSMFSTGFVDSFLFRPQTDPVGGAVVLNPGLDSGWIRGRSGEFTTADSSLGFVVDYWAPDAGRSQLSDDWKTVFTRVGMTNLTASPIPNAYLAYGWDWDVPAISMAQNLSGFIATGGLNMMYQQGAQDTSLSCLDNDRRFAAVRYFSPTELDDLTAFTTGEGAGSAGFQALYTRRNLDFVQAEWNHPALDTMLQNTNGYDPYTTTDPAELNGTDIHMVLNSGAYNVDPGDTVYLHFAMIAGIAGDNTTTDLETVGGVLQFWSPWKSSSCCTNPGDANGNGVFQISDVMYLIAYIFAGGPPPGCCQEGDGDGSGSITIGDVTYGINRIFGGGPSFICGPPGMTCGAE